MTKIIFKNKVYDSEKMETLHVFENKASHLYDDILMRASDGELFMHIAAKDRDLLSEHLDKHGKFLDKYGRGAVLWVDDGSQHALIHMVQEELQHYLNTDYKALSDDEYSAFGFKIAD